MNRADATLFTIAFGAYLVGFLLYVIHVAFRRKWPGRAATLLMGVGIVPHTLAFIVRWTVQGHYPLANMFEYMGLMAWMVAVGLLCFVYRFRNAKIGVVVSPVVVMLLVTASLLPSDVNRQLMPALQSIWLAIHVSLAALGTGFFLIAFATSELYLLTSQPVNGGKGGEPVRNEWGQFLVFWIAVPVLVGLILNIVGWLPVQIGSMAEAKIHNLSAKALTVFSLSNGVDTLLLGRWVIGLGIGMICGAVIWPLAHGFICRTDSRRYSGARSFAVLVIGLLLSAVVVGYLVRGGFISLTPQSYFKIFEFFGPVLVLSWVLTPLLYLLPGCSGRGWMEQLSLPRPILEDLSYSAVAVGYPLYTIGALFAGAIWAEQAWGSWWSWDPKEVGALIIWLFYTGFLHARLNRQWKGEKAAVLIVLGMIMVFVSFFGNYFFGGLHSFEVS